MDDATTGPDRSRQSHLGKEVRPRVVSLLPAAAEIVAALGCADGLVGRSHECDFPGSVNALPALTKSRISAELGSTEIEREVRELLAQSLSIYEVDVEGLRSLRPDVIVTQTQCQVCAVSREQVEAALRTEFGAGAGPTLVSLEATDLAGLREDFRRVSLALGKEEAGTELVERFDEDLNRVAERARWCERRPSAVCLEWLDPLMAGGNWMPELVEMAGGVGLFGEAGRHSPALEWEALCQADPEVLLVSPCGWDLERTRSELAALTTRNGWDTLQAVRNNRVCLIDGNQYCNRPGPRVAATAEILGECLHPDLFDFGHRGVAWKTLD